MGKRVIVQAGHEGRRRNSGTGTTPSVGTSGRFSAEYLLTPKVANQVQALLAAAGVDVTRVGGVLPAKDTYDLAVFLHFDGSGTKCSSGASVGYPSSTPASTVAAWKRVYDPSFPFKWMPDNFTAGLRGYYGYGRVDAPHKLLIEFGELTCPEQEAWLLAKVNDGLLARLVFQWVVNVLDIDLVGAGVPTYRNQKNVPDAAWAKGVIDRGIDVHKIIREDQAGDWNAPINYGQVWTLFDRYDAPAAAFDEHQLRLWTEERIDDSIADHSRNPDAHHE